MPSLLNRFKNSWNAFWGRDPTFGGYGGSYRPDRATLSTTSMRSIVSSIYNRIAVDVSSIDFKHVRLNDEGKFKEEIHSYLNDCLHLVSNIDQTKQSLFIQAMLTLLEEGSVALVPIHTDVDPEKTDSYDVQAIRVGTIINWYPKTVDVEVYDEESGNRSTFNIEKRILPIIENPFYVTMNEPNSTLKRLIRVLSQLDRTNDHNSSGKLDLIIKLPYLAKSTIKKSMQK